MAAADAGEAQRIDKWLWVARFFKTRSVAADAVAGGHVHVDGERVKPARRVRPGARVHVRRGEVEWEVVVRGLSANRLSAPAAAELYEETDESAARRAAEAERARERQARRARGLGRPSKRDRRELDRFRTREWDAPEEGE